MTREPSRHSRDLAARTMIELYGGDATLMSLTRATEYEKAGDSASHEFWTDVAQAIRVILHKDN